MQVPLDLHLGDIVRLRKPHPCGSYEWQIVRVGADIGIRCCQCGRRILLPRPELRRRLKALKPISAMGDGQGPPQGPTSHG